MARVKLLKSATNTHRWHPARRRGVFASREDEEA